MMQPNAIKATCLKDGLHRARDEQTAEGERREVLLRGSVQRKPQNRSGVCERAKHASSAGYQLHFVLMA